MANAEVIGEFFRAKYCLSEIRTCGRLTLAGCQVLYHSPSQLDRVEKIQVKLMGWDKDGERSISRYCHRQNRLELHLLLKIYPLVNQCWLLLIELPCPSCPLKCIPGLGTPSPSQILRWGWPASSFLWPSLRGSTRISVVYQLFQIIRTNYLQGNLANCEFDTGKS